MSRLDKLPNPNGYVIALPIEPATTLRRAGVDMSLQLQKWLFSIRKKDRKDRSEGAERLVSGDEKLPMKIRIRSFTLSTGETWTAR
jgi:hypothetical protein